MEEICEEIRKGNTDRAFYKQNLVCVNNLARRQWNSIVENPVLVAVQCDKIELVDFFIYLGINVNAIQQDEEQNTKTALNEALRRGYRNIVELLLKRGASLDVPELIDGQQVFPKDLAKNNSTLMQTIDRMTRKIPYY